MRSCVVDLPDGSRRGAAYASLLQVVQALLHQSEVAGALRMETHFGWDGDTEGCGGWGLVGQLAG